MRNIFIKKTLISALAITALIGVLPIAANAEWKEKDGNKYYLDDEDGTYVTGWMQESGKWYYFNDSGVMQKNTTVISYGKEYKIGADGAWSDGEDDAGSSSYKSDGLWTYNKGKWYYKKNGESSYFKGWLNEGSKWYYLDKDGVMQQNTTVKIDGKNYTFGEHGVCKNK